MGCQRIFHSWWNLPAISVNVVDPGSTDTDMNPADGPDADQEKGYFTVGHYGSVQDIAGVVTFLYFHTADGLPCDDLDRRYRSSGC